MNIVRYTLAAVLMLSSSLALSAEGLIQISSPDSVSVTADRFNRLLYQQPVQKPVTTHGFSNTLAL